MSFTVLANPSANLFVQNYCKLFNQRRCLEIRWRLSFRQIRQHYVLYICLIQVTERLPWYHDDDDILSNHSTATSPHIHGKDTTLESMVGVEVWTPCMQQKTNIGRHPFFLLFCRYRALLQLYRNKNCSHCLENSNIQQISIELWKLICMHSNKCEKCNFYTFYLIPNLKE